MNIIMRDVFFSGDFISDTGPGVANRMFLKGFIENGISIFYINKKNKLFRTIKSIIYIICSKRVCICDASRLNKLLIPICKMTRKKTAYLVHGYGKYEAILNGANDHEIAQIDAVESWMFQNTDRTICVSKFFCNYMKEHEKKYSEKFDYIFNALDVNELALLNKGYERDNRVILSIGGGLGGKNNLAVCKAIEIMNEEGADYRYIIVGKRGKDYNEIIKYPFVKFYDSLPRTEVIELMNKSKLYIQNSLFESFGLSPLEALFSGCDMIITETQGICDLFEDVDRESFIIADSNSVYEIIDIIKKCEKRSNNKLLLDHFDKNLVKPSCVAKRLYEILMAIN